MHRRRKSSVKKFILVLIASFMAIAATEAVCQSESTNYYVRKWQGSVTYLLPLDPLKRILKKPVVLPSGTVLQTDEGASVEVAEQKKKGRSWSIGENVIIRLSPVLFFDDTSKIEVVEVSLGDIGAENPSSKLDPSIAWRKFIFKVRGKLGSAKPTPSTAEDLFEVKGELQTEEDSLRVDSLPDLDGTNARVVMNWRPGKQNDHSYQIKIRRQESDRFQVVGETNSNAFEFTVWDQGQYEIVVEDSKGRPVSSPKSLTIQSDRKLNEKFEETGGKEDGRLNPGIIELVSMADNLKVITSGFWKADFLWKRPKLSGLGPAEYTLFLKSKTKQRSSVHKTTDLHFSLSLVPDDYEWYVVGSLDGKIYKSDKRIFSVESLKLIDISSLLNQALSEEKTGYLLIDFLDEKDKPEL